MRAPWAAITWAAISGRHLISTTRVGRAGVVNWAAIGSVVCWATMAPFAKYAFDQFPATAYLGLRPLIAAAAAFLLLQVRGMRLGIGRTAWRRLMVAGGLGYGLAQIGFVTGLDRTSVSHLSILVSTSPLIGALIVPIVARRLPRGDALAGMLLGLAGVALLVGGGGSDGSSLRGDLLVLMSALAWVGATIWPIPLVARYGVEVTNAWMLVASLALILPFSGGAVVDVIASPPPLIAWGALFYGAIVGVLIGNGLWQRAVLEVGADSALVYQYLTPVISLALAIALLGERPTLLQLVGSALALLGVWIVRRRAAG